MARLKRTRSIILDRAEARAAAISSIATPLELGGELTLASYQASVADARSKLSRYNALLSDADEARAQFDGAETALADLSERMLAGVASQFGRDSDAYEKAGGTRKSDRRRPTSLTPATAEPTAA